MLRNLWMFLLIISSALAGAAPAEGAAGGALPRIYDETLDGSKQIAEAITVAAKEHKRVLVQFGANWCIWCRRMNRLFQEEPSIRNELRSGYVVIKVDVNKGHNEGVEKQYQAGKQGIPCLVLIDGTGTHLTTKDTEEFEEVDHYQLSKVLAFLKQWAPRP